MYLSRRGGSDWSSQQISPPLGTVRSRRYQLRMGSPKTSIRRFSKAGGEPPLTPEASPNTANLYLRDNTSGSYRLLSVGAAGNEAGTFVCGIGGISADASHVVFVAETGIDRLRRHRPKSTSATGTRRPARSAWLGVPRAATKSLREQSTSRGSSGRRARSPQTARGSSSKAVAAAAASASASTAPARRSSAKRAPSRSPAATARLPTSPKAATSNATTSPPKEQSISPKPSAKCRACSALPPTARGSTSCRIAQGDGENNLYLWTAGGGFEFIATGIPSSNWTDLRQRPTSRVTPDGMHLAFTANNSLTGYPNEGKSEVYLYSAATRRTGLRLLQPDAANRHLRRHIEGPGTNAMRTSVAQPLRRRQPPLLHHRRSAGAAGLQQPG